LSSISEIYKNTDYTGYIQDVICVTKVVNPIIDKGRSDVKAGTNKQGSLQGFVLDRRNIIFERAKRKDAVNLELLLSSIKHRKATLLQRNGNKPDTSISLSGYCALTEHTSTYQATNPSPPGMQISSKSRLALGSLTKGLMHVGKHNWCGGNW